LQVPHHGSRTGLERELLEVLAPQMAIISVGKNNYGHPSKEIVKLLGVQDIKLLRTDMNGNIEIVSDGRRWWIH
jgi:competence protein ComEC